MYFIDRNKINQTLDYMESLCSLFSEQREWQQNKIHEIALERLVHVVIESIIDVGNSMIDGFIMRDPGSYEDIIDIMNDEKVITPEMAPLLKDVIGLRKMIVMEFTQVDSESLMKTFGQSMEALQLFPVKVRHYLENELGPVSAFLPVDK